MRYLPASKAATDISECRQGLQMLGCRNDVDKVAYVSDDPAMACLLSSI